MKTAFKAKIIFESDRFETYFQAYKEESKPTISYSDIYKIIKKGNVQIDIVGDELTNNFEPVLIIKELENG